MPNHVHGIVMMNPMVGAHGNVPSAGETSGDVGAHGNAPDDAIAPAIPTRAHYHLPLRRPRSLATFVGGFKGAVNRRINEMRRTPVAPVWQSNYYEHIIRNEDELIRIREYILTNPLHWAHDDENPEYQPMKDGDEDLDWYV